MARSGGSGWPAGDYRKRVPVWACCGRSAPLVDNRRFGDCVVLSHFIVILMVAGCLKKPLSFFNLR